MGSRSSPLQTNHRSLRAERRLSNIAAIVEVSEQQTEAEQRRDERKKPDRPAGHQVRQRHRDANDPVDDEHEHETLARRALLQLPGERKVTNHKEEQLEGKQPNHKRVDTLA